MYAPTACVVERPRIERQVEAVVSNRLVPLEDTGNTHCKRIQIILSEVKKGFTARNNRLHFIEADGSKSSDPRGPANPTHESLTSCLLGFRQVLSLGSLLSRNESFPDHGASKEGLLSQGEHMLKQLAVALYISQSCWRRHALVPRFR
jgi:hypothetical protein